VDLADPARTLHGARTQQDGEAAVQIVEGGGRGALGAPGDRDVQSLGMTGYTAADWLRGQRAVAVELADHRRVMAALSHADTDASVDRTLAALRDMVDAFSGPNVTRSSRPVPGPAELRTEQVMRPRDAFFAATESAPIAEAGGRIAAEFVTPYPPGIPLFVPGERITEAIVEYLRTGAAEASTSRAAPTSRWAACAWSASPAGNAR
jgi:arginine/lysine/ornithine decarboxylase